MVISTNGSFQLFTLYKTRDHDDEFYWANFSAYIMRDSFSLSSKRCFNQMCIIPIATYMLLFHNFPLIEYLWGLIQILESLTAPLPT